MLSITATDLKTNLGKYLSLVTREEIHITKNGEDVAMLVPPKPKRSVIDELIGVIPNDGFGIAEARKERLERV